MRHLDDGILAALVDGEVGSADLDPIRRHLDACADCRLRLELERGAAAEADALIEALPVPELDRPAPVPARSPSARRGGPLRRLAWAASVVAAAGLGYAGRGRVTPPRATLAVEPPTAIAAVDAGSRDGPAASADAAAARADEAAGQPSAPAGTPEGEARSTPTEPKVEQALARADVSPPSEIDTAVQQNRQKLATMQEALRGRLEQPNPPVPAGLTARIAPRDTLDRLAAKALADVGRPQAPAPARSALREESVTAAPWEAVGYEEGIRTLGGQLRLLDGLVPERLERAGARVRVVYLLDSLELRLEQWRVGDSVTVRLLAIPPLGQDSLARLRARIR